jgi:hypothetical protein
MAKHITGLRNWAKLEPAWHQCKDSKQGSSGLRVHKKAGCGTAVSFYPLTPGSNIFVKLALFGCVTVKLNYVPVPMANTRDIKVVVRSPDGHYLTGGPTEWQFTDDLAEAAVFNYLADEIESQLQTIRTSSGVVLEAVHVASHELCETCDRCKENMLPTIAFYDGRQFLCPDCHVVVPLVFEP